jgi:hypothetical protein
MADEMCIRILNIRMLNSHQKMCGEKAFPPVLEKYRLLIREVLNS